MRASLYSNRQLANLANLAVRQFLSFQWFTRGYWLAFLSASREGPMTKNELNRFRAVLTLRVAELERLTRHREGITVERSADELEDIQAASQRAVAVCNLDREFNERRNARAALRRIHEGCFGVCQECDQDINPKRLAAVPWAAFCLRCQEAADRNLEDVHAPNRDLLGRAAARSPVEQTYQDTICKAA